MGKRHATRTQDAPVGNASAVLATCWKSKWTFAEGPQYCRLKQHCILQSVFGECLKGVGNSLCSRTGVGRDAWVAEYAGHAYRASILCLIPKITYIIGLYNAAWLGPGTLGIALSLGSKSVLATHPHFNGN